MVASHEALQPPLDPRRQHRLGGGADCVGSHGFAWCRVFGKAKANRVLPAAIATSCSPPARKVSGAARITPPVSTDQRGRPVRESSAKKVPWSPPNTIPPFVESLPPTTVFARRGPRRCPHLRLRRNVSPARTARTS